MGKKLMWRAVGHFVPLNWSIYALTWQLASMFRRTSRGSHIIAHNLTIPKVIPIEPLPYSILSGSIIHGYLFAAPTQRSHNLSGLISMERQEHPPLSLAIFSIMDRPHQATSQGERISASGALSNLCKMKLVAQGIWSARFPHRQYASNW
ncbi:hypothetical protein BJX64DRAFT_206928 [Aspergillus heterothallicus]